MKTLRLFVLFATFLAAIPALGTITCEVYNGSSLFQTLTPTFYGNVGGVNKYDLSYSRNNYNGVVTLKIRGATTDGLHFLNVTGDFSGPTAIDIAGTGTGRFGAVDSIMQTGTHYVSL